MPLPAGDRLVVSPRLAIPLAEIRMSASPSGGPGGQHANRSSTRVDLVFDVLGSPSLSASQKARLARVLCGRMTAPGSLRVSSRRERSQFQNRRAALARLAELLASALAPRKPRTATRPTAGSREARLAAKKRRAAVKRERARASDET